MSLLKANSVQIGQSATATQNFTLSVPASPDGTIKLARGNSGATTADVLTVDASGNVTTTLATGSVKFSQLSTSATEADNVASRTAKAWVKFDGTLAAASMIQGAFNVSSITDYGVGDYEVNFLVSMSDVNYTTTVANNAPVNGNHTSPFVASPVRTTYSTGVVAVASFNISNSGLRADPSFFSVIVFR